jgi:hypothetical protein
VGDGPVLRVVSETEIGGTLVELDGGGRTEIRARREVLYDPERGLRRTVRLAGVVQEDYGLRAGRWLGRVGDAMQAFTRDYREALRSGRAHVVGEGEVRGTPVYWIRVPIGPRRPMPRNPCRPYRFCQDVAISRETYKPVYLSITPPGFRPRVLDRILSIESLPAGTGAIPGKASNVAPGFTDLRRTRDIDRATAARLLGREPAWPGRRLSGLPLEQIDAVGFRTFVFTREMRRPRYRPRERVVRHLFRRGRTRLLVSQARRLGFGLYFRPGFPRLGGLPAQLNTPHGYAPPRGWVLITGRGHEAILRHRGLFVSVLATRKADLLPAVRALRR